MDGVFLIRGGIFIEGGWDGGASEVTQWYRICLLSKRCRRCGFNHWGGKIPWRRKWQHTPVYLPGKSHGQKSLAVYSPWSRKRDTMDNACMSDLLRGRQNWFL